MSDNEMPNQNGSNFSGQSSDYLEKAADACAAGDLVLGMHLYLAAYEKAVADPNIPDGMALSGLREAWQLACDLKERSMAEYVFEKLEPYLTGEEIAACAGKLQSMALERLEEYGFSREDLEGMAEMISQDFIGGEASVVKVESISLPHVSAIGATSFEFGDASGANNSLSASLPANNAEPPAGESDKPQHRAPKQERPLTEHPQMGLADVNDFNPYDMYRDYSIGKSYHCATNEGSGAPIVTLDEERAQAHTAYVNKLDTEAEDAQANDDEPAATETANAVDTTAETATLTDTSAASTELTMANVQAEARAQALREAGKSPSGAQSDTTAPAADASSQTAVSTSARAGLAKQASQVPQKASGQNMPSMPNVADMRNHQMNYQTLIGYDRAIATMRDIGIGLRNDREFLEFLTMLNEKHGLENPPSLDTIVFRAPIVEDAARFVEATANEIGLPVLRMAMEEGVQGVPVLVVMTQGNHRPRMNHAQNKFEAPAILVIDELDTWSIPSPPEGMDGIGNFIMANISRGAREAVNLIRSAVEDPNVLVFATASTTGEPDPFFFDLLEPITIVDIDNPDEKERADIWMEIADHHPSMRAIDREALMRLSAGMPRYDMYLAAREAIEEAYKMGLVKRSYMPVTPQIIFEKLAACQPLDSSEYQALEDEVVRNFLEDLDHLEDLLDDDQL